MVECVYQSRECKMFQRCHWSLYEKPSGSADRIQHWNSNNKAAANSLNISVDWQLQHSVQRLNVTRSFPQRLFHLGDLI